MIRLKRLLSSVLACTILVSATSCSLFRKTDPQEIIGAAESFAKSVAALDSKKILKSVETIDYDDADEFKDRISLNDMASEERDLKQAIADTIEFKVDEDSVEFKKDMAYCDVEFSIVNYADATKDLTGKSDEFIDAIQSYEKTSEYTLPLKFVKSDDSWLVTADCLDYLDDLYSFIDYEFVFGLFSKINEEDFFRALEVIGIQSSNIETMENTSFSFDDNDTDFEVEYNIDAYSDNENYYSFTRCVDEATAKALFQYYYDDYKYLLYSEEFTGTNSYEIDDNSTYFLIDGRYDDRSANTYTPYHDAIFLKGNTVVFVMVSDYDSSLKKEINDFLDALGYPHP